MNIRWAWTLPVLPALAATLVAATVQAQGQPGGAGALMPQPMPPQGMYAPAGAYPQAAYPQAMAYPVPYAAAPQFAPALPDANGSYGYMPVEFASQPYAPPGAAAAYAAAAYGQPPGGPAAYGQPGYGPPVSAMFDQGGYGGYADAYGAPDGQMGPGGGGMGGACPYCGGQGCPQCGPPGSDGTWMPNGLLGDVLGLVAPYPDGGCAAPRWYDFAVDYMMLKRDNTGFNVPFTSLGIGGPIVLDTNDLNFGSYKPGFRFSAAVQIAAANSLEFTYFGMFNYVAHATARAGASNLFSAFSGFGLGQFPGPVEFSNADFQQITYQSTFDSFETNWRCRWMAPNCRYQGSWLIGVRHFILDEKLRFATSASRAGFNTPTGPVPGLGRDDTDVTNDLTGIQIGGDTWLCLLPGLRAGAELQAGVYGNHQGINATIGSNVPGTDDIRTHMANNNVAFIGQLNTLLTYRINYQWSLRGGYQFLYVSGVALAPENFNPNLPNVNNPFATAFHVHDNGFVFYHGWNVGVEYMW